MMTIISLNLCLGIVNVGKCSKFSILKQMLSKLQSEEDMLQVVTVISRYLCSFVLSP